jgi:hypothetical protein
MAVLLVQCDEIEGPVHQPQSSQVDTTCSFTADTSPVKKKVLIEEFTASFAATVPLAAFT